jgi:hypothetical protein
MGNKRFRDIADPPGHHLAEAPIIVSQLAPKQSRMPHLENGGILLWGKRRNEAG